MSHAQKCPFYIFISLWSLSETKSAWTIVRASLVKNWKFASPMEYCSILMLSIWQLGQNILNHSPPYAAKLTKTFLLCHIHCLLHVKLTLPGLYILYDSQCTLTYCNQQCTGVLFFLVFIFSISLFYRIKKFLSKVYYPFILQILSSYFSKYV